jgi:hypothetical protein
MQIKFIKDHTIYVTRQRIPREYRRGETYDFPDEYSIKLIEEKIAIPQRAELEKPTPELLEQRKSQAEEADVYASINRQTGSSEDVVLRPSA